MLAKICILAICCIAATQSLNIISRAGWGARPAKWASNNLAVNPPSHVAIHHGDSPSCYNKAACTSRVKSYQDWHMDGNGWNDIGYNFVVGEDGNVYEGQGWGKHGAHAVPLNRMSIGICVIGSFNGAAPNAAAQKAVQELIAYGVSNGKIQTNYKLVGHRQVDNTDCPGTAFYNVIKGWKNWSANP
ncbi:PREDICTED: peptidoglycan-recognition protein SC2-like [Nicrophorus vespilloides]|uniref:Peptidoglycan-recognition protein n=1 Tax=Nicrophorus vespilloides TaxID=110193 RepID=A0ABM1NGJ9_NICVS|nr:PREDICTED: peptidoglycan-recognition protein SC2-like [Nicrophorus vespilloides]